MSRISVTDPLRLRPLPRRFYQRDTVAVARGLLGKVIVRRLAEGTVAARIDEVEAYLGVGDPAAHSAGGRRTARNRTMWGPAGHLYVYFVYGMHSCANVVTRKPEIPEAVLLRGAVPLVGEALVAERRGSRRRGLLDGPAKLCQGLALDTRDDGRDLTREGDLFIADDGFRLAGESVLSGPRVGVGYAGEAAGWPLRFLASADHRARKMRREADAGR